MKLAQFQYTLVQPQRNCNGYGYSYADLSRTLDSIWKAGNGEVGITQTVAVQTDGSLAIDTRVFGIEELTEPQRFCIPNDWRKAGKMSQAQADGSAITYARRYHVSAMLGVIADGDDDRAIAEDIARKSSVKAQVRETLAVEYQQLDSGEYSPKAAQLSAHAADWLPLALGAIDACADTETLNKYLTAAKRRQPTPEQWTQLNLAADKVRDRITRSAELTPDPESDGR